MVKIPLGQEGRLSVEMAEGTLLYCLVAPFANVRSCEDAVVVFRCLEVASLFYGHLMYTQCAKHVSPWACRRVVLVLDFA